MYEDSSSSGFKEKYEQERAKVALLEQNLFSQKQLNNVLSSKIERLKKEIELNSFR